MPFTSRRRRMIYESSKSIHHFRAVIYDIYGNVVRSKPLFACDELDAMDMIQRLADGRDIELWDGPVLVRRLCQSVERPDPRGGIDEPCAPDADQPGQNRRAV